MRDEITIYEEETNLIWGVVVVVAMAMATFVLGDAFVNESLFTMGFNQLVALFFLLLAMLGILKITEPLYRFELSVNSEQLTIDVFKGEDEVTTLNYNLNDIERVQFAPSSPSPDSEALFDFSPTYYIVYQKNDEQQFQKLIDLGDVSFTLRVPDIGKIIYFIRSHNPEIEVPAEQRPIVDSGF